MLHHDIDVVMTILGKTPKPRLKLFPNALQNRALNCSMWGSGWPTPAHWCETNLRQKLKPTAKERLRLYTRTDVCKHVYTQHTTYKWIKM